MTEWTPLVIILTPPSATHLDSLRRLFRCLEAWFATSSVVLDMVDCQSTLTDDQWESLKQISIHVDELSFKTMAESFETLTNDIRKTNVPMNRQDNIDRSQWLKEFEKQTYAHYQGGGKSQQSEAVIPDWIEWTLVSVGIIG